MPRPALLRWRVFVFIVLGYTALSWITCFTRLHPDAVPPIMLSAGFGVAMLTRYGLRYWPAVLLGSQLFQGTSEYSTLGLATSMLITSGSTLQSVLGALIGRRLEAAVRRGARVRTLLLLLGVAAPAACAIAAAIGTLGYTLNTRADTSGLWLTWWVSNTLGVVLIGPACYALSLYREASRRAILIFVLPLLALAVALGAAHHATGRAELNEARSIFKSEVQHLHALYFAPLEQDPALLRTNARFLSASEQVTQKEFNHFNARTAYPPGLIAVEWAPRVITAQGADRYPVALSFPEQNNATIIGLDHGSDAVRRAAMDQTLASDLPRATADQLLVRSGRQGLLMFLPVYGPTFDPATATLAERREALRGFMTAVFDVDAALLPLADEARRMGLAVQVRDTGESGASGVLLDSLSGAELDRATLVARHHIDFGGHIWEMIAVPLGTRWGLVRGAISPTIQFGMLLAAVLTGLLVVLNTARNAMVHRQLRIHESFDHLLLENLSEAVLTTDTAGRLTTANRRARTWMGNDDFTRWRRDWQTRYTLNQGDGTTPFPDGIPGIFDLSLDRPIHDLEVCICDRASPRSRWFYTLGRTPLRSHDGELIGALFMFTDITARKRAEAALLESQHLTQSTLDGLDSHICLVDETTNIVLVNAAWRKFALSNEGNVTRLCEGSNYLQICEDALADTDPLRAESRHEAATFTDGLRAMMRKERDGFTMEYSYDSPQERRWFRTDILRLDDPNPGYMVIRHTDITAAKASSDHLRRLSMIVEQSPSAIAILDLDGHIHYANPSYITSTGYAEHELLGKIAPPLRDGDADPSLQEKWHELITTGGSWSGELENRRRDGTLYRERALVFPVRDEDGHGSKLIAIKDDITATHQSEERRRILGKAVAASANGICILTRSGLILYANPAFELITGYPCDEIEGNDPGFLLPDERSEGGAARMLAAIHEARSMHFTMAGQRKDGSTFWSESSIAPILDEKGGCEHMVVVLNDISMLHDALQQLERSNAEVRDEQQRLEQRVAERTRELSERNRELKHARDEAERASQAKSVFLATMSHEIRTPINGIIGTVEILGHADLPVRERDMAHTIRNSAFSLLRIIDDILDFSKIEAGQLTIVREAVNLLELVEDVCVALAASAVERDVDLHPFVDPALPPCINVDPTRLRQILNNLIGNAIKFSGDRSGQRGRVAIRVESCTDDALLVPGLALSVADNGIGIDAETLPRLFTPFTQANDSTTRHFGGTGLGLVICKRLVESQGGTIRVQSTPGTGSVFRVWLPLQEADCTPGGGADTLAGIECLVVDGPHLDAHDICAYLNSAGARTRVLEAGQSTAGLDDDGASSILVIDIAGPAATGSEAARLKTVTPHAGVVLLTRGRRQRPRHESSNTVSLDCRVLRRERLIEAVALASGRTTAVTALRAEEVRAQADEPLPDTEAARAKGTLILVAEDDPTNQRVILQQLALLGYAADLAPDGATALLMWRRSHYALLITDMHMPGMDGQSLTEAIRTEESACPERARTPIIALTANVVTEDRERALRAGMDDYLIKPLVLERLRETLASRVTARGGAGIAGADARASACSPDTETANARIVDLNVLIALVGDDQEFLHDLLGDYLGLCREQGATIVTAARAGKVGQIVATAHKLKSSSRSVGALRLGDLCAALEDAGRHHDIGTIMKLLEPFEMMLRLVESEIAAYLVADEE